MDTAFRKFEQNHQLFLQHFPLDLEREEIYAKISVDEANSVGSTITEPFERVSLSSIHANKAGITTDEFAKIVKMMAEFASIVASQPAKQASSRQVTAKKRIILSAFGFAEHAYNLLGSTASLATLPEVNALMQALHDFIAAISKFILF